MAMMTTATIAMKVSIAIPLVGLGAVVGVAVAVGAVVGEVEGATVGVAVGAGDGAGSTPKEASAIEGQ